MTLCQPFATSTFAAFELINYLHLATAEIRGWKAAQYANI